MTTPTTPIVNLNGTARSDLIGQYIEAMRGLQVALDAMSNAYPHGRDYPGSVDRWRAAVREHDARRETIVKLIAEYEAMGVAIQIPCVKDRDC
jgi:hypothetical protein